MNLFQKLNLGTTMLVIIVFMCFKGYAQQKAAPVETLLFSNDFVKSLNKKRWLAEIEPVGKSSVYTKNGKLIMDTAGGITILLFTPMRNIS
ncbi:hypothetical protein [Dyadobacter frigoris]|uniref:Uncharacterized protein n=1 Tax=Dyadobacter frigoris TaxID=2576211 RepID=A0A4V6BIW5_9BACT|nr:hypothetical protein [Dyadobacter frigoris]TKT90673.1 hypothetical protein FDK13_20360 [Dyadobacter frigoris]GLU51172.1 hypothetical protein Dfri01_06330 [Dyadobacter frigoris]